MLQSVIPNLFVRDIEETVEFFTQKLGFSVGFTMNGPNGRMMHAGLNSGDVMLMAGYKQGDHTEPSAVGGGAELYVMTDAVDALYEQARSAGAPIAAEIADQFWGDRTFTVTDPNGYLFTFAQTVRPFDPATDIPAAVTA